MRLTFDSPVSYVSYILFLHLLYEFEPFIYLLSLGKELSKKNHMSKKFLPAARNIFQILVGYCRQRPLFARKKNHFIITAFEFHQYYQIET